MKGLVVRLSPTLLFGPPPKTRDDLKCLIKEHKVSLILNTCAQTNERTKSGVDRAEFYMQLLKPKEGAEEEAEEDKLYVTMKRLPLNLFDFEAKGRTQDLQEASLAQFYVTHARALHKEIEKSKGKVVYIHNGSGVMEEAYLAFAVWKMVLNPPAGGGGVQPLDWIRENNYEWLFDDDNDKKDLLSIILNEVDRGQRKINFFKKVKN